jgi:hypothetical protein
MATVTSSKTPLQQFWDSYLDQFEQLTPKVKQGVEDWYNFSGKALDQYFKLQQDFWDKWLDKSSSAQSINDRSKSFIKSIIDFQKEAFVATVDSIAKTARTVRTESARPTGRKTSGRRTAKTKRSTRGKE